MVTLPASVSVRWSELREVPPGVVLDHDEKGNLVGIDIDHARRIANLERL